jgi:hypothetical protein
VPLVHEHELVLANKLQQVQHRKAGECIGKKSAITVST